ncbi:recombinase RecA, partial [bacterium]|nr:recombinase RecA [bacterium]
MSDFLKDIIKQTGNEYASLASDGTGGDVDNFIDTGSYSFNALLSGSIYGGLPDSRITAIAGEAATGKTFFALGIVKAFLDKDPDAGVIYFESESAVSKSMVESRGIDSKRLVVMPVSTVQEFRTQSLTVLDKYIAQDKSERKPIMFVLDSLGMLSTTKEMDDTAAGKETRDMTRSQIVKSTFRVLTLKLGQAGVPMIMTNHTYDVIGSMFPQKEMGGGSGLKYAASSIIYLGKRKEKEGTEVVGNIIHCKNYKSRITKENAQIDVRLSYKHGLDRHYGLLELAEEAGIFKKVSTRIELPDGTKQFGKTINDNPETYFTKE